MSTDSPGTARSAATFELLTGGRGVKLLAAVPGPALAAVGYAEQELVARGEATSYEALEWGPEGRFVLQEKERARFATRVLVRRPTDPARFNGTLVVEWLNVSSGDDAAPDYTYLAAELVRGGYAWAGVSAQYTGVEGGQAVVDLPDAGGQAPRNGLRNLDPERYGDLHHPGDAYCYDLFTQVARGLGDARAGDPLEGLEVTRTLAVGESQSAFALTTYVNGVQPRSGAFDGFLVHSRARYAAPLGEPGGPLQVRQLATEPVQIRQDLGVPVVMVQTETDLLGSLAYLAARQPDGEHLRLWEVAGSAHADKFVIGEAEAFLGCPDPINRGQQSFVVRAALRHLDAWSRGGPPAPSADRLELEPGASPEAFALDDLGNVRGGVRTPAVDAPVDVLSGLAAPEASYLCRLFGSSQPLAPETLAEVYGSREVYLERYRRAAEQAVQAGFVLAEDQDVLLADAQPERLPG